MNFSNRYGRASAAIAAAVGVVASVTMLNHGYLGAQTRFPIFLGYKVLNTTGALVAIGLAVVALLGVGLGQRVVVAASAVGYMACAILVLSSWRETNGQPGSNPLDNSFGAGGPALCMFLAAAIGLAVMSVADRVDGSSGT